MGLQVAGQERAARKSGGGCSAEQLRGEPERPGGSRGATKKRLSSENEEELWFERRPGTRMSGSFYRSSERLESSGKEANEVISGCGTGISAELLNLEEQRTGRREGACFSPAKVQAA